MNTTAISHSAILRTNLFSYELKSIGHMHTGRSLTDVCVYMKFEENLPHMGGKCYLPRNHFHPHRWSQEELLQQLMWIPWLEQTYPTTGNSLIYSSCKIPSSVLQGGGQSAIHFPFWNIFHLTPFGCIEWREINENFWVVTGGNRLEKSVKCFIKDKLANFILWV